MKMKTVRHSKRYPVSLAFLGTSYAANSLFRILLVMTALSYVFLPPGECMATIYYVSNDGADENDGTSPDAPWQTLDAVNMANLAPDDVVLFRRGHRWRGQLRPQSGDENASITYGAYDEGEKPRLLGSVSKNREEDWSTSGDNIWFTQASAPVGDDVLPNSDIPGGAERWHLYAEHGAAARSQRETSDVGTGHAGFRIACAAAGTGSSDIQFYAASFSITRGGVYQLTFHAKSTVPLSLTVPRLMRSGPPWSSYATGGDSTTFPISNEWTAHTCHYVSSITAADARLTFFLGDVLPAGTALYLDKISLRECNRDGFLRADVGNIIFDGGTSCGIKRWEFADLDAQDEYWYDEARHLLALYSVQHPATRYREIECALRDHIIDQSNRHHIVYEDLALYYGAAHGIGGGATHHVTVRNCDFAYIGGGDQMGGDRTVRFGNGVEFWGTAHDHLVEGCRLWEIYDAALTNQSSGPNTPQYNITYRNNVVWNCEYSFEYWNRPEISETYNIRFENNICHNAGGGWGHAQRPDPSGRHLCFYDSPAQAHDIIIRNNVFCEALGNAFYAPSWTRHAIDALIMDNNCWFQSSGDMIHVADRRYPMDAFVLYQQEFDKEPNSVTADPLFVDADTHDFELRPGSPCAAIIKQRTGESLFGNITP